MERYLVQRKDDEGFVSMHLCTEPEILTLFGFRDCTGCDYQVFMNGGFGEMIRLEHIPADHAPFNYHRFVSSINGELMFDGYSPEH